MLNKQQLSAVHYVDGPLLVLAGAGSGKTRVITHKIDYLIRECGYAAKHIVAVTFTNKAANEMKHRVGLVVPAELRRGLTVATFHALGQMILKKDLAACGLKRGFSIFDAEDCAQLISQFLPPARSKDKEVIQHIQQNISHWKNALKTPEMVLTDLANLSSETMEAAEVYSRYQLALQTYNAVDFDDLIRRPVALLQEHAAIRDYWQQRIRHLLIDEYQDSNVSQYVLVQLLIGDKARVTVVGDDDQSIYAWRGAKPENLAQLKTDYPQLKIIKLEQNYRSTGRILHAANHLIAHNTHLFDKKLWSEWGPGDFLRILVCKDEQDEAEQVVADLLSHKVRHGTSFGDYAILYRGNHQARVFEKVLRHYSILYRISGGQSWFARQEIKDILAYLKLLCNEDDDAAFLRAINTPKRGIGDTSLEALGQYAQSIQQRLLTCCDHLALESRISDAPRRALAYFKKWIYALRDRFEVEPIEVVLRDVVESMGYEAHVYDQSDTPAKAQKKMDNVWELCDWIKRILTKKDSRVLADALNHLMLLDILEKNEALDGEEVQLMTLHASKGLEFKFVYLVGMEEELLPHRVSIELDHIEEERRLAYVGITRAQKALCLSLAKQRRTAGMLQDCQPSRFLEELPEEHLEWFGQGKVRDEAESKALAKSHLQGLKELLST